MTLPRVHFIAFLAALALPAAAVAQTNEGPIEQPHSSATSDEQPGRPGPGRPESPPSAQRQSESPLGPADNDPAHPEIGAKDGSTK